MIRQVTDEEIETYRSQGVVKLPGLVDGEAIDGMLAAIDAQISDPSEWLLTGTHLSDRCFGIDRPALRSYLLHPTMGENAARAMGSTTARFYFDHAFVFEPNSPVDDHYWHQDLPYWPVAGDQIVSFWLSLVHCTPATSALKFVPGTHHNERLYRPKGFDGSSLDGGGIDQRADPVDADHEFLDGGAPAFHNDPDAHGVLEFSYEPGDAVMFHTRVVHSSGGNNSPDLRRVAYSTRYVGDDAHLMYRARVFQDPALLPDPDEAFDIGGPMQSRRWPLVHG
jgi:ectoine hydroxylase-related dioxygenase (phytanoyl-CoA dioxygenase family)